MKTLIQAYGCVTAAGPSASLLWEKLSSGQVCLSQPTNKALPRLVSDLVTSYEQVRHRIATSPSRLGVIFASTKGCIDDLVWNSEVSSEQLRQDPVAPVLSAFLNKTGLVPARKICVSNACASTVAALYLARLWLKTQAVDQVLVLAADLAGPFVTQGFKCLQALSPTQNRPFSVDRDGLRLGSAAVALLVGTELLASQNPEADIELAGVGLDTEGFAATRPDPSGTSLVRAYQRLSKDTVVWPDLIIAHGTGTLTNDPTEDAAFSKIFHSPLPSITGTKWCTGHTLGASAGVDVIAACLALKHQHSYRLATTQTIDPTFRGNYLHAHSAPLTQVQTVLTSSLGFGGTHGMVWLKKGDR